MKKSDKLVFFGSGPVAAASLQLLAQDFDIEAVITKPRPPHHRGDVPVLRLAEKLRLRVLTAADKAALDELFENQKFEAQAAVLIDFGIIVSQKVIYCFPLGIINSHFSLLPQWRGADPITFALLSGQKTTGISLMLIEPTLDTGRLLARAEYDIEPDETIISLTENLVELSNRTLREVLPLYFEGKIVPVAQDPSQGITYSRKLTKSDGLLDLNKPAKQLEREVRAFLGWPKSRLNLFGQDVIVLKTRVAKNTEDGELVLTCNPGYLEIKELVAPSGRRMSGVDFLRGYKK